MKRKIFRVAVCMLLMFMTVFTPIASVPSMSASAASMKVMRCNVQGGRLRKGPSSAYDVITTLDRGERIVYSGIKKKAFCLVCTADGKIGYVYSGFLSNYGSVRREQLYYTKTRNVKIYKSASTKAKTALRLKNREMVIVYKKAGNWAYVKTLDGKGGFVPLSNLNKF